MLRSKRLNSKLITIRTNLARLIQRPLAHLDIGLNHPSTFFFATCRSVFSKLVARPTMQHVALIGVLPFALGACSQHECDRSDELCGSYIPKLQLPPNSTFAKSNNGPMLFTVQNLSPRAGLTAQLVQGKTRIALQLQEMDREDATSTFMATGDIKSLAAMEDIKSLALGDAQLEVFDAGQPMDNITADKWPHLSVVYKNVSFPPAPSATFVDSSISAKSPSPVWLTVRQETIYSHQTGYNAGIKNRVKLYNYDSGALKQIPDNSSDLAGLTRIAMVRTADFYLTPDPMNPIPTFSNFYGCPLPDTTALVNVASCATLKGTIQDGNITHPLTADKEGNFVAYVGNDGLLKMYQTPMGGTPNDLMPVTVTNPPMPAKRTQAAIVLDLNIEPSSMMPLRSDILAVKVDGTVETYLQTKGAGITVALDSSVATIAVTGAESLASLLNRPGQGVVDVLASGDIDGDGTDDIAVVRGDTVTLLLNQSYNGYKTLGADIKAPWAINAIAIGDVNNDGKADIVMANTLASSIAVYLSM